MEHKRMPLREAWHLVKEKRSVARPNPTFIKQLGELELKVLGLQETTLKVEDVWPPGETYINLDAYK